MARIDAGFVNGPEVSAIDSILLGGTPIEVGETSGGTLANQDFILLDPLLNLVSIYGGRWAGSVEPGLPSSKGAVRT